MSTFGTLATGFTGRCGTCKVEFTDEAYDRIEQLTKDMIAAKWQIFPTCCPECIEKLGVWYTDDRDQKSAVPAGKPDSKPTKKATGDDTGPIRRRMRRRLL